MCLTVTLVPLFLILGYLLYRGTSLDWDFFTKLPVPVGETGGGMVNAFYGSFLMVGVATLFSVPVGVLSAIYLEFGANCWDRLSASLPSCLAAFRRSSAYSVFYVIVKPITGTFSGLAGGFALGVMMIPIVLRTTEEALKIVPKSLRDASHALVLTAADGPACFGAGGSVGDYHRHLFEHRAGRGNGASILTASSNSFWPRSLNHYTPSLPVFIFNYAISPYDDWHRQAWAAAFVLVMFIMVLNVGVRLSTGKLARLTRAERTKTKSSRSAKWPGAELLDCCDCIFPRK